MLDHDIPPFDLLRSQKDPYDGFGPLELDPEQTVRRFHEVVRQAQARVAEIFKINETDGETLVSALDYVVAQMWKEGWDLRSGDINLFTRDFGALLMDVLLGESSGHSIFRSTSDLSSASVYWPHSRLEAFPFHKAFKCLTSEDGESLSQFLRGIRQLLAEP